MHLKSVCKFLCTRVVLVNIWVQLLTWDTVVFLLFILEKNCLDKQNSLISTQALHSFSTLFKALPPTPQTRHGNAVHSPRTHHNTLPASCILWAGSLPSACWFCLVVLCEPGSPSSPPLLEAPTQSPRHLESVTKCWFNLAVIITCMYAVGLLGLCWLY